MTGSPFDLDDIESYQRWRDAKIADHPTRLEDLVVEIANPFNLTEAERTAMAERVRHCNMSIYITRTDDVADKNIGRAIMQQFGVVNIDKNPESDDDGVTNLTPRTEAENDTAFYDYIPFSKKPIQWHTDGYYNAMDKQVRSLMLHCVRPSDEGGDNELMDHEMMYIMLRDMNPKYIRALSLPDTMTIPPRIEDGVVKREERPGPVFSVYPDGRLHMRYTHRVRSIVWKSDPMVTEAVAALKKILAEPTAYYFRGILQPGWGLVCNNILHTRMAFSDAGEGRRSIYRIRYYDYFGV